MAKCTKCGLDVYDQEAAEFVDATEEFDGGEWSRGFEYNWCKCLSSINELAQIWEDLPLTAESCTSQLQLEAYNWIAAILDALEEQ